MNTRDTHSSSTTKKNCYHPYEHPEKCSDSKRSDKPAWKNIGNRGQSKRSKCRSQETLNVNFPVVTLAYTVEGHLHKKDISPVVVNCYQELKYVKGISCVTQLSFVKHVPNVPTVALDLPGGARLHKFWEICEALEATPSPFGSGQT